MLSAQLEMTQLHEPADNKTVCGYASYSKIYYLTNIQIFVNYYFHIWTCYLN